MIIRLDDFDSLYTSGNMNVFRPSGENYLHVFPDEQPIGNMKPGVRIFIGEQRYIVLGHGADTTALLLCNVLPYRSDDVASYAYLSKEDKDTDFMYSPVQYLLNILNCSERFHINIPSKYIVKHKVKYYALNGERPSRYEKRNVSLLTVDLYQRYRDVIPRSAHSYWLITPTCAAGFDSKSYGIDTPEKASIYCEMCAVRSDGRIGWCALSNGKCDVYLHPYLIVDSQYRQYEQVLEEVT